MKRRFGRALRCAAAVLLFVPAWAAAEPHKLAPGISAGTSPVPSPFSTELLLPGLYRINGAGSSSLLRVGVTGMVMVDSKRRGTHQLLMAEVARVSRSSSASLGALVLSAAGPDQAGNVAAFVNAGIPVIVDQRALPGLGAAISHGTGSDKPHIITYDTDYLLHLGDVEIEIEHVGKGRTGTDSVLYFRDLRAVAVGELYTTDTPQPDCGSGGSYAGWAAAISHLMWFDFDWAVPSRGPMVGKPELLAFKNKLQALALTAASSPSAAPGCAASANG